MNQIPNIEEVETNTALNASIHKNDMDGFTLVATFATKELAAKAKEMVLNPHQELQKARTDWLREEIVRLEGMKRPHPSEDEFRALPIIEMYKQGQAVSFNTALQTIIDRYQSELDQPMS